MFHRNEVGITPMFPQKLDWYITLYDDRFVFNSPDSFWNFPVMLRFTVSLWDLEAKSWDHELLAQTIGVGRSEVTKWALSNKQYLFVAAEHLTRPQSSQSITSPPSRQGRRKSSGNWAKARTSVALSGELRKRARMKKSWGSHFNNIIYYCSVIFQ